MDNKVSLNRLKLPLAQRLEGLDKVPQWAAFLDYLKDEEDGARNSIMALSDLWEQHVWDRKIAQLKGVLLLCRMIRAIPDDVRLRLEDAITKKEIT